MLGVKKFMASKLRCVVRESMEWPHVVQCALQAAPETNAVDLDAHIIAPTSL